jgi:hypothetical protein
LRRIHHNKNSAAQYCAAKKLSNGRSELRSASSARKIRLQSRSYRRPHGALTQLLDNFWNDFNRAIDLSISVEPAKRKAQAPAGGINAGIHCAQYMRSFL